MNPEILETLVLWGIVIIFGALVVFLNRTQPIQKDDYYNEHDDLFH